MGKNIRPLKICFISPGESIHVKRQLNYYLKNGHQVYLISANRSGIDGVVEYIRKNEPRSFLPGLGLLNRLLYYRKCLNIIQPDILQISWLRPKNSVVALLNFHPLVAWPWGSDVLLFSKGYSGLIQRLFIWLIMKRADLILSPSEQIQEMANKIKRHSTPNLVVGIGVDIEKFRKIDSKEQAKSRLSFSPDDYLVFSPRGTMPVYNIDVIIRSIPLVVSHVKNVKYILKIADETGDRQYLQSLKKLISELGVNEYIIPKGLLTETEMVELYNAADLVVSIPSSDAGAITVKEAMACGTAVVVSDLPSLKKVIIDKNNGLVVPVKSETALASAIIEMLTHKEFREGTLEQNIDYVAKNTNFQKDMKCIEQMYYSLLGMGGVKKTI